MGINPLISKGNLLKIPESSAWNAIPIERMFGPSKGGYGGRIYPAAG